MRITGFESDSEIASEIGARLKALRIDAGLTQAELGKAAGVSTRTVANTERGKDVTMGSLVRMLRALGVAGNLDSLVPSRSPRIAELKAGASHRQRVRASSRGNGSAPSSWAWGEDR